MIHIFLLDFLRKSLLSPLAKLMLRMVPTFCVATPLAKLCFAGCLLFFLVLPVNAETILIKRHGSGKSKALLDKKFVFMQSNKEEAFTRSEDPRQAQTQPSRVKSSPGLSSLSSNLDKIPKKVKTINIANQNKETKPVEVIQENIYNEDNWSDYAEYQDIELDESLGVNAKILNKY